MLQNSGGAFDLGQAAARGACDSRGIRPDAQRVEGFVAELPLFRGLPRASYAPLGQAVRLLRFGRGEAVVRRGEAVPGVFLVAEGMVNVALRGAAGAERVLRFVTPGKTFGEAAALLGRASAIDATALADSAVAVIPGPALRRLLARNAALSMRMAMLLAERMLDLLDEIEASELRPAVERLADYLMSLANPRGRDGALIATLPATKTLVASRLGMKKETLSRLLHDLAGRGLIRVSQRDITILDGEGLREAGRPG